MKVCILSMQRIDNMGSLLQAYGLKSMLERNGANVDFLDIQRNESDDILLENFQLNFQQESPKLSNFEKVLGKDAFFLNRLKNKSKFHKQVTIFEEFRHDVLNLDRISDHYDLCIIGSDEVFNCLNTGSWGFTSQLFGNVPNADQVITYAASCGATCYEKLPSKVAERIRESFANITAFSVRDQNTHEFVENLTDKPVLDHLDPVLVYDFRKELESVSLPKVPEHYCVVYSYYNRIHTHDEIEAILNFCQNHHLTPISVGAPQFWIKRCIACTPFQCLKLFQASDFVITDTFHGTIFSSKYAQKFAVLLRESNKNKLSDLVNRIGVNVHLISSLTEKELEEKYSIIKDIHSIHETIKIECKKAEEYLVKYSMNF